MFCGVGHQSVPAVMVAQQGRENVARDLWTAKRTGTQQLGGRPSAQWLSGYLCRTCSDAVEYVHAMGPTALERALVAALVPSGIPKLGWGQHAMGGLMGWGAAYAQGLLEDPPVRVPPNARPWSHLGDLAELTERLSRTFS
jgi:hypothetical protein